MMSLSGCDHGCWWEGDALVRRRPRSAMLELRRSVKFGRALSFSCPRELSPVLPKLRHLEVHAVWSPLTASLGYALPTMRGLGIAKTIVLPSLDESCKKGSSIDATVRRAVGWSFLFSPRSRVQRSRWWQEALHVPYRSKCEELRVSKFSPLCPAERTSMRRVATSLMGQERKSRSFDPRRHRRTLAAMVIRAARLAAMLLRIARDLRHADKGPGS